MHLIQNITQIFLILLLRNTYSLPRKFLLITGIYALVETVPVVFFFVPCTWYIANTKHMYIKLILQVDVFKCCSLHPQESPYVYIIHMHTYTHYTYILLSLFFYRRKFVWVHGSRGRIHHDERSMIASSRQNGSSWSQKLRTCNSKSKQEAARVQTGSETRL